MGRQTRDQNLDWETRAELSSRSVQLARYYLTGAAESCGDHSACSAGAVAIDDSEAGYIGSGSSTASFDGGGCLPCSGYGTGLEVDRCGEQPFHLVLGRSSRMYATASR